jgi:hypothetical protein
MTLKSETDVEKFGLKKMTLDDMNMACNWWRKGSEPDELLRSRFLRVTEKGDAVYEVLGFCSQSVQDACDDLREHSDFWWVTECLVGVVQSAFIVGNCRYEVSGRFDNFLDALKAFGGE